jgi:hypothetical protein
VAEYTAVPPVERHTLVAVENLLKAGVVDTVCYWVKSPPVAGFAIEGSLEPDAAVGLLSVPIPV